VKEIHQTKEYKTPQFQFVRQDEQNKIFFVASGGSSNPAGTSVSGGITSMTVNTSTGWM